MSDIIISGLYIYPIKSLRGIRVERMRLGDRGPEHDRRWMLIDGEGRFLSQRQLPRMCLIDVSLQGDRLVCEAPDMRPLELPLALSQDHRAITVQIWNDHCKALLAPSAANAWFTEFLDTDCRLVYMPNATRRRVDPNYADDEGDIAGFADGFPLLMISQASLDELNRRLGEKGHAALPMIRFRPNIVITGCAAHAEDGMERLLGEHVELLPVKPCSRCVIPSIDIATAQKGREPTATLAEYRRLDGRKIYFGQNTLYRVVGEAVLAVGDRFEVTSRPEVSRH